MRSISYYSIAPLLGLLVSRVSASSQALLETYNFPNNETGATAFALLYGKPLLYFSAEFEGAIGLAEMGTNNYYVSNDGYLSNSSVTSVVRPNVDTLYSITVLDFSESDVELYLPPYDSDRVVTVDLWDTYGGWFGSVSSIAGSEPGTYLLRPSMQGGPTAPTECDQAYQGCINSPTGDATMLVRVGVKNNGTDETAARSYLYDFNVTTVNQHDPYFEPLTPADFASLSSCVPRSILQLLSRLSDRNPPQTAEYAHFVPEILEMAGIANGTYTQPPDADIEYAYELMNSWISEYEDSPASISNQTNGWYLINPDIQGGFKNSTALLGRNWWGLGYYLSNPPSEAIYPLLETSSFTSTADESYLLTFQSKPLMGEPGLWSITLYDEDGHLVANPQNVYSVGDRSNITYPDGSQVYPLEGGNNASHADTPFQILLQREDVAPPANWTHNWLPTPSNNTNFTLTFRLYNPLDEMMTGEYQYPIMEKTAAITGN